MVKFWEKVPPFDYEVPGAGWAVAERAMSAFALAGWLVIAVLGAIASVASMRLE